MKQISITEALEQMAEASPVFRRQWTHEIDEWGGEEIPYTGLFADFAIELLRDPSSVGREEIIQVFLTIEQLMVSGDQDVGEIVATGFLEQVLAEASAGRLDFDKIRPLIGPESAKYCVAWNRFTLGPDDKRFNP